jgi:DNA-binding response OmpR family regulator
MTATGGVDALSHEAASTSIVSHADLMTAERATTIPLARSPVAGHEADRDQRATRADPGRAAPHAQARRGRRGRGGRADPDRSCASEVTVDGELVHLTPIEFKLLALLAQHAGRMLSRDQLLHEVWGPDSEQVHYLRVHVAAIRKKIEKDPARPRWLTTVTGLGYRLHDA